MRVGPLAWDLSGSQSGTYTATVEVNDGNQHTAQWQCNSYRRRLHGLRSTAAAMSDGVRGLCTDAVDVGSPITLHGKRGGGPASMAATYNWSVSAGTITSGQGTPTISVDTAGLGGQSVTATVSVGGADPSCSTTAGSLAMTNVRPPKAVAVKFDEYGNIKFNDEKAQTR